MDAENYVMDGMHHGTGSTLRMQPTHTRPHARDGHTLQPGRQSTRQPVCPDRPAPPSLGRMARAWSVH